jgi:pimeloyl-ACP methyl ester carboxylesterase
MKINLGDREISYDDRGSGQPVLLIHGYPLSRAMWQPQLENLSQSARLIAPDLRGYGESSSGLFDLDNPEPFSMEQFADDCAALLDALNIEQKVVVCGLSMGGYVALAFYRKYPQRVAGLVLTATRAGADSAEGKAGREKAAALAKEQGITPIARAMLPKLLAPAHLESMPELAAHVVQIMHSASVPGAIGALLGMRDRPDSTPLLPQVACPVLILHGAEDQIIPLSEAEAMQRLIPGARLEVLAGAGHLPNLEQPAAFNALFKEFMSSIR